MSQNSVEATMADLHRYFHIKASSREQGSNHIVVWQPVSTDDVSRIPVVYVANETENSGVELHELEELTRYLELNKSKSVTWLRTCSQAVGLLIEFLFFKINTEKNEASSVRWSDRRDILFDFIDLLSRGTVRFESGLQNDATNLYWFPKSHERMKALFNALSQFLQHIDDDLTRWKSAIYLNGSDYSLKDFIINIKNERIRNNVRLLNHLNNKKFKAKNPIFPTLNGKHDRTSSETPKFNENHVVDMLSVGFISRGNIDHTARLLAFFLFLYGTRASEIFHLFLSDIDYENDNYKIRIYHPEHSQIRSGNNLTTRKLFLQTHFSLLPRNLLHDRFAVGWKSVSNDIHGAELYAIPVDEFKEYFKMTLTHYISIVRPEIMRIRKLRGLSDHPYLLVGTGKTWGDETGEIGDPYTMSAFRSAWDRAIGRLSRFHDDSDIINQKTAGYTIHAARHFYGTFMANLGMDQLRLQRVLHHKSIFSSSVYVEPSAVEINEYLNLKSHEPLQKRYRNMTEALRFQKNRRFQ